MNYAVELFEGSHQRTYMVYLTAFNVVAAEEHAINALAKLLKEKYKQFSLSFEVVNVEAYMVLHQFSGKIIEIVVLGDSM